jgi:hypothetical protein
MRTMDDRITTEQMWLAVRWERMVERLLDYDHDAVVKLQRFTGRRMATKPLYELIEEIRKKKEIRAKRGHGWFDGSVAHARLCVEIKVGTNGAWRCNGLKTMWKLEAAPEWVP